MKISLSIARRYLFAKKSTNAINIITGVAVVGVAIGTAALVLVLSVFNGFEDLFMGMFNNFNPDVEITAAKGKTYTADEEMITRIQLGVQGIAATSRVLEEVAFFSYKDKQGFGILKGVDSHYTRVSQVDRTVREGSFMLRKAGVDQLVFGLGMRDRLGVDVSDPFSAVMVYMPKRRQRPGSLESPFTTRSAYPAGSFLAQQEVDNEYVIASLAFVQELLKYDYTTVSALEMRVQRGYRAEDVAAGIQQLLGPDYVVKDRRAQEESFLKLMQVEKWLSFAIPGLMMLLISFNMVGALWMIVLEKRQDIAILKTMGMSDLEVKKTFVYAGMLLTGLGIGLGFGLAILLYILQKTVGIIQLPGEMMIDAYPVSLRWRDFVVVLSVVGFIGYLASLLPASRAERMPAMFKED